YRHAAYTAFASAGVVLAAVYLLWMYQRVFYGEITNEKNRALADCDFREKLILTVMVIVIIAMGVYPQPFLRRMDRGVNSIMFRLDRHSMLITDRAAPNGLPSSGAGSRKLGVEVLYPISHSTLPTPNPLLHTAHSELLTPSVGGGR
ncbi:MAG: hypothetical protein ABSF45_18180, partial [Terriglobia bacterium]